MEEKQKGILDRNRWLFLGNIIMTEEFFQALKTENVLPDTMIKDIKVGVYSLNLASDGQMI